MPRGVLLKTTMCEMKNTLDVIYCRLDATEEKTSKLGDIAIEAIQNETEKNILEKSEERISELRNNLSNYVFKIYAVYYMSDIYVYTYR